MRIMVEVELEVNLEGGRANIDEISESVDEAGREFRAKLMRGIVERYQEGVVQVLCSPSGRQAKRGLGVHSKKGQKEHRCRCRTFRRAGTWAQRRRLHAKDLEVEFRPAVIECEGCGKKLTPVLQALELEPYQRWTTPLLRKVMEAVADTSYRRGSHQLKVVGEVPVAKSTMHRWAASLEWPFPERKGKDFLLADGTGFKRQPGERGEVRIVLELGKTGEIRPLGVWAGTPWKEIGKAVRDRLRGQPRLFVGDGEQAMEMWVGEIAKRAQRSQWHFVRDSRVMLWHDGVQGQEAKEVMGQLAQLLAIEIPEKDFEEVSLEDKSEVRESLRWAEEQLLQLQQDFEEKGYLKAAHYLERARDRLFTHLKMWLRTGIVAPRTASIVETVIRELARRLKKIGWNWSDRGAAKMGEMVLLRRYDADTWEQFWRARMNLQDRCQIHISRFEARLAA